MSAEIWQNCLVLTCKGFDLFILLVEVAFSCFHFGCLGLAFNREMWQCKTSILFACLSTYLQ